MSENKQQTTNPALIILNLVLIKTKLVMQKGYL